MSFVLTDLKKPTDPHSRSRRDKITPSEGERGSTSGRSVATAATRSVRTGTRPVETGSHWHGTDERKTDTGTEDGVSIPHKVMAVPNRSADTPGSGTDSSFRTTTIYIYKI
jgi:hypothetical protein